MPAVSAIVVSYKTGPRLKECLYALSADPEVSEIVVIDNGNPDDIREWIVSFCAGTSKARYIDSGDNIGFAKGANLGARLAKNPWLLFINPDAVLRWQSVYPMIEAAKDQPRPCLVGGKIFDLDGTEQRGGRRHKLTMLRAMGLSKWTLEDTPPPDGPIEMDAVSGALFMMEKTEFQKIGEFDEGYFLHVEDLDLCRRVWASGGKVIYQPAAAALHYRSTAEVTTEFVQDHKADGLKRYFEKFASGTIEKLLLKLFLPIMMWRVRKKSKRETPA